jgi:hypothetical protein
LLRNNRIQFLKEYNIDDYELDKKQVLDQRTWVLRIGDKENGSFKDAKQQLQSRVRAPSLNSSIIQQLKTKLKQCINEVMNTETTDTLCANNITLRTDNAEIITSQQLNEQSPINMLMNFDWSQLNDGELQKIQYHLATEQQRRVGNCKSTFKMSNWNGDSMCVMVPMHKDDKAFETYHRSHQYVDKFCESVGGGDVKIGLHRVLRTISRKYKLEYIEAGKSSGLAMNTVFDDVALAALAVDCNLKNYQLK